MMRRVWLLSISIGPLACSAGDPSGEDTVATMSGETDGTTDGETGSSTGTSTETATGTATETGGDCSGGSTCTGTPPPEWSGPVAVAFVDIDAELPCPDGWTPASGATSYGELATPDLECGCESATLDGSCTTPILQGYQNNGCTTKGGNPKPLTQGQCIGDLLFFYFIISPPEPQDAKCTAEPTDPNTPPAAFASKVVACSPPEDSPACDDGICVDPGELEGAVGLCLFRDGDEPCPASFPSRYVQHRSFDDQRGCACEVDVNDTDCGDTLTGWWGDPCFGNQEQITFGKCTYAQTQSWKWEGTLTGSCTEPVPTPTGAALPTDPVTLCCAE